MLRQRAALFAAALWWGGLTALGAIAVPLLFAHLPSPSLAGQVAARLFSASGWIAMACGMVLLVASRGRDDAPSLAWGGGALLFVIPGMLLALLVEFAVAPRILARTDPVLWHRVGSAMLVAQWLCAGAVLWRVGATQAIGSDHR
jgi:hypothetical protein